MTGVDAEAVDGEVGGGVIAHDHHHGEDVFEGEGDGVSRKVRMPEPSTASWGWRVMGSSQRALAVADFDHGVIEDAELDDGGGPDGLVGVDSDGGVGVEVDGVEGGVAEAGGGAGGGELLELLLEGRGRGLGGDGEREGEQGGGRKKDVAEGDRAHRWSKDPRD